MNSLFETTVIPKREPLDEPAATAQAHDLAIRPYSMELEQDGIKISITVIDVPNFGNSLDRSGEHASVLKYLEEQMDQVLNEESRIKRNPKFIDTRVHALLYFIEPTGKGLREPDITFIRHVGKRVNVIPLLAKADAFAGVEELARVKRLVQADMERFGLPVFRFPYDPDEDEEYVIRENMELAALLPFAVVAADTEIVENGRRKRGRSYPWGFVDSKYCLHSPLLVNLPVPIIWATLFTSACLNHCTTNIHTFIARAPRFILTS